MNKYDLDRISRSSQITGTMIAKMYEALTDIAKMEHSLDGGITARHIAIDTLVAVNSMADKTIQPVKFHKFSMEDSQYVTA